jgi:hypothetical protein
VLGLQKRLRTFGASRADEPFLKGEVSKLRQLLADTKYSAVAGLCRDLVAGGDRVVVWCWHHETVDTLAHALWARPAVNAYPAHGGMPPAVVRDAIKRWSEHEGSVLVTTSSLLGTGENVLSRHAHLQIFQELPWKVDTWDQTRSRFIRMDVKEPVMTYVMVADVPFERSLFDRLLTEAEDTDQILGDNRRSLVAAALGLDRVTAEKLQEWLDA